MRTLLIVLVFTSLASWAQAQTFYYTKTGHVWFFSSTPVEDIEAHNNKVTAALEIQKNEVEFKMAMKDFEFEKSLMQEHFNDNYVESDDYPYAIFTGEFVNFKQIDFTKPGSYPAKARGVMKIHGVARDIEVTGKITVSASNKIQLQADFEVKPADYDIKIPKIVVKNIAEIIQVHVDASVQPLKN